MGIAGLFLWIFVFVAAGTGASLLFAAIVTVTVGLARRSKKITWLGAFMTSLAGLTLSFPIFIWLETFYPSVHAGTVIKVGSAAGVVLVTLSFAVFIRCSWQERRWN
jgi:hypothetical protein